MVSVQHQFSVLYYEKNENGANEPLFLYSTALSSTSLDELRIYGAELFASSIHFDLGYISVKPGLQTEFSWNEKNIFL